MHMCLYKSKGMFLGTDYERCICDKTELFALMHVYRREMWACGGESAYGTIEGRWRWGESNSISSDRSCPVHHLIYCSAIVPTSTACRPSAEVKEYPPFPVKAVKNTIPGIIKDQSGNFWVIQTTFQFPQMRKKERARRNWNHDFHVVKLIGGLWTC